MFNPTSVQEMQLKTTEMSQPLRWVKCVIQTMTSIGEDVGKYNHRLFVLSEIWCNHLENNWAKPSKIQSMPIVRSYIPLLKEPSCMQGNVYKGPHCGLVGKMGSHVIFHHQRDEK